MYPQMQNDHHLHLGGFDYSWSKTNPQTFPNLTIPIVSNT